MPLDFKLIYVEDKIFTPHGFISLATHTTSILPWILGKIYFKTQKNPYLHKMMPKPMVHNPRQYYLIKAHGSSSWHIISFSAHDPNSWVSSREFWESWFGGPRSMFNKAPTVQSWQRLGMSSPIPWTLMSRCAIGNI